MLAIGKILKWTTLGCTSSGTVGASFVTYMLNDISYEMNIINDNRFDMTDWQITTPLAILFDMYEYDGIKYLSFNNQIYSFESNTDEINDYINLQISSNQQINDQIDNLFEEKIGIKPHSNEMIIKSNLTITEIYNRYTNEEINDNKFSIDVFASDNSVILKPSTIDYTNKFSFDLEINLNINKKFDLSYVNGEYFNNLLMFYARRPECSKIGELNSYQTFDYEDKSNILETLTNDLVDYLSTISRYPITAQDFTLNLEVEKIHNINFSVTRNVSFLLEANSDSLYLTNSGTIIAKMLGQYYVPSLNVIDGSDFGEFSFYTLLPSALDYDEFDKYVVNNETLKVLVVDKIKNEIDPSITENDINVIFIGDVDMAKNYSNWKTGYYMVTSNNENLLKDQAFITYKLRANREYVSVTSSWETGMKWEGKVWHEGTNMSIFSAPSYGNWKIEIFGFDITYTYNINLLNRISANTIYTATNLVDAGIFNYGGLTPKMTTNNGSYIQLGTNDYMDVDFPGLSWLGLVDGSMVTLDSCEPRSFDDSDEDGKDWIVPGSKSHDFHLRITNFWNSIRFEKKKDANNQEYLAVSDQFQSLIGWNFAKNSRWGITVAYTKTYPSGNFPYFTFSNNEIEPKYDWE